MTRFEGRRIVKQDNGKMIVVNKKVDDSRKLPSEWAISDKKMGSQDINMINKKLGKKKKRKSKN